eukprot:TRINITY_DN3168_c0_g2_i1.p1 TRINITY_DN3168_c0_g2~~TRINITY_DN3168_c0_g2_i1.p1  ORF type:complete len:348 (+),score=41.73 TRINITY_DN3168_c0_g2_i1:39-1046(+)
MSAVCDEDEEELEAQVLERHNVKVLGWGPQIIVFAHCFGESQRVWKEVVKQFDPDKYKLVVYDLVSARGDPQDYNFQRYSTLHGYADDLLHLIEGLEVQPNERCTFVGHSVSGMIGIIASIECPQAFDRLILLGSSPRYLDIASYRGGFKLEELDDVFGIMQDNYSVWLSGLNTQKLTEDVFLPHVWEFCNPLFLLRPDISFSMLKTIFSCDLRHLLPQVAVQVHLLHLPRDPSVPCEVMQYMMENIPMAYGELLPMPGFFHNPNFLVDALKRHLAMERKDDALNRVRVGNVSVDRKNLKSCKSLDRAENAIRRLGIQPSASLPITPISYHRHKP